MTEEAIARLRERVMSEPKQYIGGRIVGGYSLHAEYKPELCAPGECRRNDARCVDCCKHAGDDNDIVECPRCGAQWVTGCTFDDDYS